MPEEKPCPACGGSPPRVVLEIGWNLGPGRRRAPSATRCSARARDAGAPERGRRRLGRARRTRRRRRSAAGPASLQASPSCRSRSSVPRRSAATAAARGSDRPLRRGAEELRAPAERTPSSRADHVLLPEDEPPHRSGDTSPAAALVRRAASWTTANVRPNRSRQVDEIALGFEAKTPLREGLEQTIVWYRSAAPQASSTPR